MTLDIQGKCMGLYLRIRRVPAYSLCGSKFAIFARTSTILYMAVHFTDTLITELHFTSNLTARYYACRLSHTISTLQEAKAYGIYLCRSEREKRWRNTTWVIRTQKKIMLVPRNKLVFSSKNYTWVPLLSLSMLPCTLYIYWVFSQVSI